MDDLTFINWEEVKAPQARTLIPAGEYAVSIVESQMKPTKKGDGRYAELKLEVLSGPQKGRWIWERLNVDNPNAEAVRIAQERLKEIGVALGIESPKFLQELNNKPLTAVVAIKPDREGVNRNNIRGFKATSPTEAAAAPAESVESGGSLPDDSPF